MDSNGAKRLLTGGRSVIIDGNTLDPTLQVLLAAQRAVGITGLVVDDDVVASRTLMREACRALPGPQIHVAVNDMSIPGPGGDIPVRHYRPAVAERRRCWSSTTAAAGPSATWTPMTRCAG
ncbi:lipase/esterase domain protein [Mycobacterium xenopi 3993]|nr:lipase/esterase domain protein [Mycobacterium xenopi 3993]